LSGIVETRLPLSASETIACGGAANSRCLALRRCGYGLIDALPPGCISKCRCEVIPSASPESPTKPTGWPAATASPLFRPFGYATPATHLPRLSFFAVRSLLRWT
jgi:hypothetical protein